MAAGEQVREADFAQHKASISTDAAKLDGVHSGFLADIKLNVIQSYNTMQHKYSFAGIPCVDAES